METNLKYRPDIDGLRAIAVLAVIAYHLKNSFLPGGFTGVDVFFVMSGFLVTGIIDKGLKSDTFSLLYFYSRRIKRIIPAWLVVVITTYAVGIWALTPDDFKRLTESNLFASLSASNVYFWKYLDTGYFSPATDDIPLLHTWSLGVEEQFYLLWPVLLILLSRVKTLYKVYIVFIISASSYMFSSFWYKHDPSFVFYMLPARAGEFLAGAIVSLLLNHYPTAQSRNLLNVMSSLGGISILLSFIFIDKTREFPGVYALPSSIGTALLIYCGGKSTSIASKILSTSFLVNIGKRSYSLYLWHWPIISYTKYFYKTLSPYQIAACAFATVVISYSSYSIVESPFRRMPTSIRNVFWLYYLLPTLLIIISCLIGVTSHLNRPSDSNAYSTTVSRLNANTAASESYAYNCQLSSFDVSRFSDTKCILGKGNTPTALLWGDSHAAHYVGFLGAMANHYGFSYKNISHSECPPILSEQDNYGGSRKESCTKFRTAMLDEVKKYSYIFIAASWSSYMNNAFRRDLENTIDTLKKLNKHVIILSQVPTFPNYNKNCELRSIGHAFVNCKEISSYPDEREQQSNAILRNIATKFSNVKVIDVRHLICKDGTCSPYIYSEPIYYDAGHLSMHGSWLLGDLFILSGDADNIFSHITRDTVTSKE